MQDKICLIIDSNSIVHRAYHAIPGLKRKDGTLVNAIYGFFSILMRVTDELAPNALVASFDLPDPTFRHKKFSGYKATRPSTPSDLIIQFNEVKRGLRNLKVPIFEKKGFEADDIVGTIAKQIKSKKGWKSIILTGDRDLLQLIDNKTSVYLLRAGIKDSILYDTLKFKEDYIGLIPQQLVELNALKGDVSDNIPGVQGIGPKTATSLVLQFKNIDNVYKNINSLKVKDKLIKGRDSAFLSRELIKIKDDVSLKFDLKDSLWSGYNNIESFFEEMEFSALLKRIKKENQRLF
ncbi:MAG: 5'-3' exonuclease H3TH domain-containing protein [Candidatus Pacebacteria bacterium]|nr:5'-3' exonuclease H3TH domain-containing protein [Candidatus Paceibacterota bacterium]